MTQTLTARALALTLSSLLAAFAVHAQEKETPVRENAAQNGGAAAIDTTPKYNPGLNGRVKPAEAKVRTSVAQNGGEAAVSAYAQPKYNSALSGRAGAAPTTLAGSRTGVPTTD